MSTERGIEFAALHADPTAVQPWGVQQRDPAEELMAREAEEEEEISFAGMFRLVLVYCFSGAEGGGWELPVHRAVSIVRNFFRGDLCGRTAPMVRERHAETVFPLTFFDDLLRDEAGAKRYLRQVMAYLMPQRGNGWEREAGKRLFLLAKAWLPLAVSDEALSRDKVRWVVHELSYEQLAVIFGEIPPNASRRERGRARARWCALKNRLIEMPVQKAGGRIHLHFSKSESTRAKCAEAQRGNRNRRGRRSTNSAGEQPAPYADVEQPEHDQES